MPMLNITTEATTGMVTIKAITPDSKLESDSSFDVPSKIKVNNIMTLVGCECVYNKQTTNNIYTKSKQSEKFSSKRCISTSKRYIFTSKRYFQLK